MSTAKDDRKKMIEEQKELLAAEQAKDFINIAEGIHLMAVKSEHLIPEILNVAGLTLEY